MKADAFEQDMSVAGISRWKLVYRWSKPELYFLKLLRSAENKRSAATRSPFHRLAYLVVRASFEVRSRALGFTIPLGVFGGGLSIAHRGTIVVNRDARVGQYCRIHPGVTIGSTRGAAPILGDDVFIAPGAGIFGGITIGSRVHIGPGVIVTTDVPDDTLLIPPPPVTKPRTRPIWRSESEETREGSGP